MSCTSHWYCSCVERSISRQRAQDGALVSAGCHREFLECKMTRGSQDSKKRLRNLGILMPTRFDRPATSSRDSRESADTSKRLSLQRPILERCGVALFYQARCQNRVRAFQHMLRSGERMQRRVLSPLPSRQAQDSGKFVWPISGCRVSIPLG